MQTETLLANSSWMETIPFWIDSVFYATTVALVGAWIAGVYYGTLRTPGYRTKVVPFTLLVGLLTLVWMGFSWGTAESGFLREFNTLPPRIFLLFIPISLVMLGVAFTGVGYCLIQGIGLPWLIGFQGFRIFIEIYLHGMADLGLTPQQMTWNGYNFDVLTGLTAPVVAWLLWKKRISLKWVWIWNLMGLGWLVNVVTIAILSFPTPFRQFMSEPSNVFVTYPPHAWLPMIHVQAAWLGHWLVFRALWIRRTHRL